MSIFKKIQSSRWIYTLQGLWLLLIGALFLWWGNLLTQQSEHIRSLEIRLGMPDALITEQTVKLQRMLFWESTTFIGLLVISGLYLIWLYRRHIEYAKTLQAFFASVTHELRTPITGLRLQSEFLVDKIDASSPLASVSRQLLKDIDRLTSEVDRLLELTRVESGGSVSVQHIAFKNFFEKFLKKNKEDRLNAFTVQTNIAPLDVVVDPHVLEMILRNIFENISKYADSEFPVTITAELENRFAKIMITNHADIESLEASKLGELFYQTVNSRGTGIGLYLIKALMKLMNGKVEYRFHQKLFTTTLYLPAESEKEMQ